MQEQPKHHREVEGRRLEYRTGEPKYSLVQFVCNPVRFTGFLGLSYCSRKASGVMYRASLFSTVHLEGKNDPTSMLQRYHLL